MLAVSEDRHKWMERSLRRTRTGYFSYDPDNAVLSPGPEMQELLGIKSDALLPLEGFLSLVHGDDQLRAQKAFQNFANSGESFELTFRPALPEHAYQWFRLALEIVANEGEKSAAFGIVQDINDYEIAKFQARSTEKRLRDYAEAASDWFWETDRNLKLIYLSKRFETQTGRSVSSLLGRSQIPRSSQIEGSYGLDRHMSDLQSRRAFRDLQFWITTDKGDETVLVSCGGVPVFDEANQFQGYRGVGRNVTALFEKQSQLHYLANCDELTGLLNRRSFEQFVQNSQTSIRGAETYLILLNLDRFKYINDNFGHRFGDLLLQAVAKRLEAWLPPSSTIARFSSDEFAIILSVDDTSDQVVELLKACIDKLGEPYRLEGATLHVRVSIGVTRWCGHDLDNLMIQADIALNVAKSNGGGRVEFFGERQRIAEARRKSLERELRDALANNEFSLVFQPQIGLLSGKVVGAEALLRWRADTENEISPFEFVPIAEDIGLMPDIGRWVLDAAVKQQRLWLDAGLEDVTIAVNVSATQFVHDVMDLALAECLAKHDVPARLIELEITESVFMQDEDRVAAAMHRVRQLGASMALDDFGTGYSSLSYLRNFQVDRLKIDRSFIQPIVESDKALAIVESIVRLAHGLKLEVVAEGVEEAAHVDMLRCLNCQIAQGYHYAKPLAAEQFLAWARDFNARSKRKSVAL